MGSQAPDVTPAAVRSTFTQLDPASLPITTAAVAEKLGCEPGAVASHLETLATRGELASAEITGGDRIWWLPDAASEDSPFGRQPRREFSDFVSAVKDYAIFKLDPDGVIANWNDGAERIKGYAADEIVGEHFSTFYTDEDVANGVPERNLDAAIADGRVEDEGWRVREDGTRFWANVTITAVWDDGDLQGFTKVTRDMTEQREYDRRIHQERDLTEQVLETVPVSICLATSDGEFVRANQRMLDRLGITEEELSEYSVQSWEIYDSEGEPIPTDEWPWSRVTRTDESVSDFRCQADMPDLGRRSLSIDAAPIESDLHEDDLVVVSIDDITDRKEHERELRRESNQTEKLLRTAPIAIAVQDVDGETVLANQRAQEALGLSEQEFIEEPEKADQWEAYDADGEPLPSAETPPARVLATGEPVYNEEMRFDPPDGDEMQFRVNAAPVFGPDGALERVITAGEEITELKQRERQLEQRKAELETELSEILDRISDAFYALDDEWRFTHLNDRAAELLQQSTTELLGRKVWEAFPESTESVYWEQFQTAMDTQEPVTFEIYEDGVATWFEFNVYPSPSGLSIYFRDITERKEYERKLEESNERLEQFAYAISHDLQEPLRMVTSYLQLIEDRYTDALDEDGEEFIEFAVDGADRMREMIDGLLEYSRVETHGDPFEPVDLDSVVADVRDDLQIRIQESDAEISVGSLPRVDGDRGQLRQLFQNLLDNAIEYSGDEPPAIEIDAERDGDVRVVSVRDEGIGIDADDQERIFEIFQRLHASEEHDGTGVGLALCRRIVERHGGEIRVESEPGEWTTFSFTLPAPTEPSE